MILPIFVNPSTKGNNCSIF